MKKKSGACASKQGRLERRAERLAIARVSARDEEAVGRLIEAGLSAEALGDLLERAALGGTDREEGLGSVRRLLAAGASPHGSKSETSPLGHCLENQRWGMALELARAGGRVAGWAGDDGPLAKAAGYGAPFELLEELFKNQKAYGVSFGREPLFAAWAGQRWEAMGHLLRLQGDAERARSMAARWQAEYPGLDPHGAGVIESFAQARELEAASQSGEARRGPRGL